MTAVPKTFQCLDPPCAPQWVTVWFYKAFLGDPRGLFRVVSASDPIYWPPQVSEWFAEATESSFWKLEVTSGSFRGPFWDPWRPIEWIASPVRSQIGPWGLPTLSERKWGWVECPPGDPLHMGLWPTRGSQPTLVNPGVWEISCQFFIFGGPTSNQGTDSQWHSDVDGWVSKGCWS